ncbi:hypothetical protein SLS56_001154 [Neofusicoccum ribis]|uniref:L domain-like protein n=1 Tax=Neofusicoccum ribis TaxID=45134 RepID=A0ABR3TBF0_9PEZI
MSPIGIKSPVSFKSPAGLRSPPALASPTAGRVSKTPLNASKTVIGRLPKTRPAGTSTFDDDLLSPAEDSEPMVERTLPSRPVGSVKKTPVKETASDATSKVGSSSAALREQIAKAKAARKAAAQAQAKPATPVTSEVPLGGSDFDSYEDPFNQLPKGGEAVIKKRVDTARSDGRLNIANMGLSEIPKQVLTMYEYDPNAGASWSEAVDLVRFNAADNEIERLEDELFPDIDPEEAAEDMDATGPQFGGLEMLDLHGNILKQLPIGLRRLERLTVLNMINSLRELRLAENDLEGDLPNSIGSLTNLEVLELQGNKIGRLPDTVQELVSLRVLNVNNNGLSSLPVEALQALPLVDLSAAKNALRGTLFPDTVPAMQRLQNLDVSGNALTSLGSSTLSMPSLKSLNVSINRLETLPDLTGWTGLLTLLAEENKLSEFPSGFTSLMSLKQANFNGNDISKIDPEIGLMENLDMFTLAANPLRERKFLTMNTADLKRDLKMRHNPAAVIDEAENGGDLEDSANGIIPTNSMWTLKSSGVLDLSSKELTDLDEEQFTPLANDCRQLILHHNNISYIPDAVALAQNITLLDLSNNRLTTTFTDDVSLPSLRELRLSANRLPSLEFLVSSLSAPRLGHLDVSSNRLSGPLPHLRRRFPELITLLASDNGFESITVEALDGLTTVALANNSIDRVPPQVGLLWEKGLRSLEIEGNTFRVPTYATLKRGTEAVMSWLRDKISAAEMPARYEVEDEGDGLGDDETF